MRNKRKLIFAAIVIGVLIYIATYPHFYEKRYYKDLNNYVTSTAVVEHISQYSAERLFIEITEADEAYNHGGAKIWYPSFVVTGKSVELVLENGLLEKLQPGDEIIFTSAPRILYNGHALPIVYLELDGEVLLPFEVGYENLMDEYLFG